MNASTNGYGVALGAGTSGSLDHTMGLGAGFNHQGSFSVQESNRPSDSKTVTTRRVSVRP